MTDSLSLDEKFIINIFEKYLKAKIIIQKIASLIAEKDFSQLYEKETQYGKITDDYKQLIDYRKHLQVVETILALMPKEEYSCLVKDFLKTNDFWWKKYYSQDAYQELRNKAINRFLYLFLI